jgi:acetylornithine/N-succinyldiaminopimelate aminotransferase
MICFEGAFHGRTLAMLSATGNAKYLKDFGPAVDGFDHVPFGNMNALRDAITPQTAGILVEPIQGEGGVRVADPRFLQELRAAADEFGLLLALDEVQCGMGRTGKLFAHEYAGIRPDVVSAAKGIAGGFPMGAILATEAVARHLTPGSHGTTFGGNPLACAAANAVLDVLLAPGFLDQVSACGQTLRAMLQDLVDQEPSVFEAVRGTGLMLGLKCRALNTDVQKAAVAEGLLTVAAGENVLRIVPPLIVTEAECADATDRLARASQNCRSMAAAE